MSNQVTFTFEEALKRFGKSMEDLSEALEDEVNEAIGNLAFSIRAKIEKLASQKLHSTYKDYSKALDIHKIGENSYLISLTSDWANSLEGGWNSYDMRPVLLSSQKMVSIGHPQGHPGHSWVKQTKDRPGHPSHRYAHVPFEKHPYSKAGNAATMADAIKNIMVTNMAGVKQRITDVFKDLEGNVLHGTSPVAVGKTEDPTDYLNNLTKYQYKVTAASGKETIRSVFINYRTISDLSTNWQNKGFKGLKAFAEAAADVPRQLDEIVQKIFGG